MPGSVAIRAIDAEGHPEDRAGSHPDRLQIDFGLNVEGTGTSARDLVFELPPGLGGNPGAVPECPRELFEKEECSTESQVGAVSLKLAGGTESTLPIFELEPAPGELLAFGSTAGFDVPLTMELRPDDFGITFKASDLPEAPLSEGHIELWGVPADRQAGPPIPRHPFLTLPTRCGVPLSVTFRTRSRQTDAPWLSESAEADTPLSGCEDLAFEPQLGLTLGNPVADSPTGTRMDITAPQDEDPDGRASAQIRSAVIELPEGVTVSPGGAVGLTACSDAQLGLGETSAASCPPSSKVGTVEVVSPVLRDPLLGDVYLGAERPGERFRLFIVAPGPGVVIKSVGALHADPNSGRLSAALKDLPQVPLSRLSLNIDGGPQALLASPLTCGSFSSSAGFDPYSGGPSAGSAASVTIGPNAGGSQCSAAPFSPRLFAAGSRRAAGRSTALTLTLARRAGEQLTRRFAISLPEGLTPALGQIEPCSDSAAALGACPAGSRLGSAFAEVGSGSSSAALRGDVYVAGPYRRAPFSLLMTFGATIGPFDLGKMVVRAAIQIHGRTGRVTIATDPLPLLVEGVPARIQTIGMSLDRPGAIRNPTSCEPAAFDATLEGSGGTTATATSTLAVSGCDRLGFRPRFSLVLSGRSQLHRHGRPSLRISARLRPGDTNLRAMHLSLPRALQFSVAGLTELCPRQDATDGLCASGAQVGTATAQSPLLGTPLHGAIYAVQPTADGLPDLWFSVATMGLRLDMRGSTTARHGHFVTNLVGLPDMPLSAFAMQLRGGRHGVLSLRTDPCSHPLTSSSLASRFVAKGQDGAQQRGRLSAKARCGRTPTSRDG